MINKNPVFIVSSGRSGTFALVNALKENNELVIHHEFLFELVLKSAVLYKMKLINEDAIEKLLYDSYYSAIYYSRKKIWIDCSNALPWIIKPLFKMFPKAKFIHLIRDGRKVVNSFYNKFESLMYNDDCVIDMLNWLNNRNKYPIPPPEKKYWRPIPIENEEEYKNFISYDQFQRICYYWNELNKHTANQFYNIPEEQKMVVKFEDLLTDNSMQKNIINFIGVKYTDQIFSSFSKPVNVQKPINYKFSINQRKKFYDICNPMMEKYNYSEKNEYDVKY
tara:strand:+ start:981 stop:1814 length:834 start_codon:yes stop_codon:yes gene_type:complete